MTICRMEILIFKCVSFALFFLIMLMYYLCLLRGFFIHSDQNIWGENSGKLDYTSKKDKSQITDWIFKIQHNCANMMSNTKQMVGYKEIQHFRGNKLTQNAFFCKIFLLNAQFHLAEHLFVFRSSKCLNVFFLIRFLFKCLQLLVCLAGSQSFYKWKIQ